MTFKRKRPGSEPYKAEKQMRLWGKPKESIYKLFTEIAKFPLAFLCGVGYYILALR